MNFVADESVDRHLTSYPLKKHLKKSWLMKHGGTRNSRQPTMMR